MAPSGWVSVVLFIFFIAPGLLFEQLASKRRAAIKESAFRETSRIVLASLWFSAVGVAAVGLVGLAGHRIVPPPAELLADPGLFLRHHYWSVARGLGIAFFVAFVAVYVTHGILAWRSDTRLRTTSMWRDTFRPAGLETNSIPFVRVKLTDGSFVLGYVRDYSAEVELADRELVLRPPLFTQGKDESSPSPLGEPWQRMILRGSTVERIDVFLHKDAASPEDIL